MPGSRKNKPKKQPKAASERHGDDVSFQDRLMGLLEWLADKDPVRAARLVGDYLEDLAVELGPKKAPKPTT